MIGKAPDREGWWRTRDVNGVWSCVFVELMDRDGALLAEIDEAYYDLDEMHEWGERITMPDEVTARSRELAVQIYRSPCQLGVGFALPEVAIAAHTKECVDAIDLAHIWIRDGRMPP